MFVRCCLSVMMYPFSSNLTSRFFARVFIGTSPIEINNPSTSNLDCLPVVMSFKSRYSTFPSPFILSMVLFKRICMFLELYRSVFYHNLNVIQKNTIWCVMEKIPTRIQNLYVAYLKKNDYSSNDIPSYLKWLRYYLDFCHKYSHTKSAPRSLSSFLLSLYS